MRGSVWHTVADLAGELGILGPARPMRSERASSSTCENAFTRDERPLYPRTRPKWSSRPGTASLGGKAANQ